MKSFKQATLYHFSLLSASSGSLAKGSFAHVERDDLLIDVQAEGKKPILHEQREQVA